MPGLRGYLGALTEEVQNFSQDTPCEICDEDGGTETGLSFSITSFFHCKLSLHHSFHVHLSFGGWAMDPLGSTVLETESHRTPRNLSTKAGATKFYLIVDSVVFIFLKRSNAIF